jgi:serine/threonine-protein kinase
VKRIALPLALPGGFHITQLIGRGGMADVYKGTERATNTPVAVKILSADADEELAERFVHEARILATLDNPHLVKLLGAGKAEKHGQYLVMEFLDGVTLGHLLHYPEVLSIPRIVHIALQIARGLHAAHQAGVVHRDLSPSNVIVVEETDDAFFTKVLDFGIAKPLVPTGQPLTGAGVAFGNVAFIRCLWPGGADLHHVHPHLAL